MRMWQTCSSLSRETGTTIASNGWKGLRLPWRALAPSFGTEGLGMLKSDARAEGRSAAEDDCANSCVVKLDAGVLLA